MKRCRALGLLALLVIWIAIPLGVSAEGSSTVIGEDYVLGPGEVIHQDLVVVGGTAILQEGSQVIGDVAVMGGELLVDGQVQGDIVAFGGSLSLDQHADVLGDVISFGRLERAPEARISGNLVEGAEVGGELARFADILRDRPELKALAPAPGQNAASAAAKVVSGFIKLLVLAGLAVLAASVLPRQMGNLEAVMVSSAPLSLGVGLMTLAVSALLLPLLIVICIGIPVAFALALALLVLGLIGWLAAGAVIGQQLVRLTDARITSPQLIAAGGTVLITLLSYVPCLGALLALALVAWSLGAAVLSRLGSTVDTTWAPLPHHHAAQPQVLLAAAAGDQATAKRDTHKLN